MIGCRGRTGGGSGSGNGGPRAQSHCTHLACHTPPLQDYTSIRGDVTLFEPQLERLQRLFDVRSALGEDPGPGAGMMLSRGCCAGWQPCPPPPVFLHTLCAQAGEACFPADGLTPKEFVQPPKVGSRPAGAAGGGGVG